MTDLKKIVKRRTVEVVQAAKGRVIIALKPGDVIAFREEGRRKWFEAPVSRLFTQVVKWNADVELAEKRRLKAERRRGLKR
jgi:hypothetical protein